MTNDHPTKDENMSVSVRCPGCQVASAIPAELLGRTGRCNGCGRRIRFATPTAELLDPDAPNAQLASLDDLGELEPIDDLTSAEPPRAKPVAKPIHAEQRPKRAATALPSGPSNGLLTVLALVGLTFGIAGGAMLVKYLVPGARPEPEQRAATDPPAPTPAQVQPAPTPEPVSPTPVLAPKPEPKPLPPEPKPEPKPEPQPEPKPALQKKVVKLSAPAVSVTAGECGRYIIFQTTIGELLIYDTQLGHVAITINGVKADELVAASRTKLFLGRPKTAEITRFDLATGVNESRATFKGGTPAIEFLAIGAASDGPLMVITRHAPDDYRLRLTDPETFAEYEYPINDPAIPAVRAFPFSVTKSPLWVSVGADGRTLLLGNRYYMRDESEYWGGLLPKHGDTRHFATADARGYVGLNLYRVESPRWSPVLVPVDPPPGTARRYVPAASGPFVVSAEYKVNDPSPVKLSLHIGTDPKPLGALPGGAEIGEWARTDDKWATKLHQRLIFAPEPGLLIFCPPGADSAHVWPINLSAMLTEAGRDIVFTSTPAAEARPGAAYSYHATAAAAHGPARFALEVGPPGMTITANGALSWPKPDGDRTSHEVKIAATDARGNRATQSFRLLMPRKGAIAEPKKKEPGDSK